MKRTKQKRQTFVATCLTAILCATLVPMPHAFAEASTSTQKQADELVQEIEESAKKYQEATAMVDELAYQIAESEARVSEIEQALPEQRDKAAASIKQLYIFQQSSPGLLELLLSAEDFNDFITALQYIDAIHDRNTTQVNNLQYMYDDLVQTQAELSVELDAALQKQDEAMYALDTMRTSLSDLQQQSMASPDGSSNTAEASEALREAEQIVATLPESVAEAVSQPVEDNKPQNSSSTEATQAPAEERQEEQPAEEPAAQTVQTPQVEQPATTDSNSWAARIDAYFASYGAPLAGYGSVFAEAAATYGVDPRLSPAIAMIESGGGKVCFLPHNAWGWGSSSWSDWNSAIHGHISGFASLYGYTLTREGAEAYASMDTWETWYSLLQSEMASI